MREIKFRGYGKDKKKWIYGSLLDERSVGIVAIQDDNCHVWEVGPESVGQYTGLRDSDGREIYEGDVVLVSENGEESKHEVRYMDDQDYPAFDLIPSSVRWCYESNGLSYCMVGYDANIEIRVIGNIHDNPELLERKS